MINTLIVFIILLDLAVSGLICLVVNRQSVINNLERMLRQEYENQAWYRGKKMKALRHESIKT